MSDITLFTIGFTKKTAELFFEKLKRAGVQKVVDVRLNNVSQLAGFTKRADLEYFLRELAGIDYVHVPELAPTKEMFDALKKKKGDWGEFESPFLDLMRYLQLTEVGQTSFTKRIRPVTSVATPLQIGGFAAHFSKRCSETKGRVRRKDSRNTRGVPNLRAQEIAAPLIKLSFDSGCKRCLQMSTLRLDSCSSAAIELSIFS